MARRWSAAATERREPQAFIAHAICYIHSLGVVGTKLLAFIYLGSALMQTITER